MDTFGRALRLQATISLPLKRTLDQLRHDVRRIRTPDTFSRNAFTVFSSQSITIGSQLLLTPLIARVYGPEAYGVYGLFLAVVMNLSSVADLGYSLAYVLPKDERRFRDLVRLNLTVLVGVMAFSLLLALFREPIYRLVPSWRPLGDWALLIPAGVAFLALSVYATQWLIREKAFKAAGFTGAWTNLSMRGFNLAFGLLTKGALHGLIVGETLIRGLVLIVYWRRLIPHGLNKLFSEWSWSSIKEAAIEYKRYPMWVFPERWVSLIALQLPLFMLTDDLTVLGHYALGSSLLLIPLRLLGFTFAPVYMQKASEIAQEDSALLGRITRGLFQRLFWIGVGPFTLLAFFGDELFHLALGEAWRDAGVVTAYLGAFFFFRLLTDPMVALFNILRREHFMLVFSLLLIGLRLAVLFTAAYLELGSGGIILAYAMTSVVGYIVLAILLLNAARLPGLVIVARTLVYTAFIGAAFALLRFLILGTWVPGF